jgi:hypothetical protein
MHPTRVAAAAPRRYIRLADEFVHVPGGSNRNNYANVELIVKVARRCEADAVWPVRAQSMRTRARACPRPLCALRRRCRARNNCARRVRSRRNALTHAPWHTRHRGAYATATASPRHHKLTPAAHPLPFPASTVPRLQGWGHASENPKLPSTLAHHNIVFIGPGSTAMDAVGDKICANLLAQSVGVNVIPWSGSGLTVPGITIPPDVVRRSRVFASDAQLRMPCTPNCTLAWQVLTRLSGSCQRSRIDLARAASQGDAALR